LVPFWDASAAISTSKSFEIKILPTSYYSPEIKQDFAAKPMIPIDRGGGGIPISRPVLKMPGQNICYSHAQGRRLLAEVQVGIVSEAGECYLVIPGYIEAKLAQAEISAGMRQAIQHNPTVTVLD
jgi:hypothetical protein